MGHDTYSVENRTARSHVMGYHRNSVAENFANKQTHTLMSPLNVGIRESRDSDEHPNSVAIILGLDVTGSMGYIPQFMIRDGLPNIMGRIIQKGEPDPQMLFIGIGDHECDSAPLQVGQFESGDELLDKWLTNLYLEGGGGGNSGESYLLAWYFAAFHTSIDCFEKRGRKGLLFTIGDEPTLKTLPAGSLRQIFGSDGQYQDYTAAELLDKAREKYEVYHLHMKQGSNGNSEEVMGGWREILGENLIIVKEQETVQVVIPEIVSASQDVEKIETPVKEVPESGEEKESSEEEMFL